MPEYLLGIDVGTTATKTVVIDTLGNIMAEASRPVTLSSPRATWAEENPEQWWANTCTLIPEVLERAGVPAAQLLAVGASGMVPALILVDEEGHPVRPSIQQNDARAVKEIDEQRSRTSAEDILARTGSTITQQSIGPKLMWLRKHEPATFNRARRILGSYDYLAYKLTGEYSIERNWALESGLYDLHTQDWDDGLLEMAGISRDWFGSIHWPSDVVGNVTEEAGRSCGLMAGTPVVAGCADHIASAFSAGLRDQGDLLVKLGGAGDILFCLDKAEVDPRLFLDYHAIPGKFLINGCMASSGSLIQWFRNQFAPGREYRELDEEAAHVPAGADGLVLLPYFLGEKTPVNDPQARGTLIGLTLSHTRAHIYRAVLEGIAYGFRHHLAVLAEHGYAPSRARVTNGGSHSLLWRQVTADVLGIRLEQIAHHPGSSLGSAFVAGMGVGAFKGWNEIENYLQTAAVTDPDMENHARYDHLFNIYLDTYQALKGLYPRLNE
jgi:xylulokinase